MPGPALRTTLMLRSKKNEMRPTKKTRKQWIRQEDQEKEID